MQISHSSATNIDTLIIAYWSPSSNYFYPLEAVDLTFAIDPTIYYQFEIKIQRAGDGLNFTVSINGNETITDFYHGPGDINDDNVLQINKDGYSGYIHLESYYTSIHAKSMYISGTLVESSQPRGECTNAPTLASSTILSTSTTLLHFEEPTEENVPTITMNPSHSPSPFPTKYPLITEEPTHDPTPATNVSTIESMLPTIREDSQSYPPTTYPSIRPTMYPSFAPTISRQADPNMIAVNITIIISDRLNASIASEIAKKISAYIVESMELKSDCVFTNSIGHNFNENDTTFANKTIIKTSVSFCNETQKDSFLLEIYDDSNLEKEIIRIIGDNDMEIEIIVTGTVIMVTAHQ